MHHACCDRAALLRHHRGSASPRLYCVAPQVIYSLCAAEGHYKAAHPECPERIHSIELALERWQGSELSRQPLPMMDDRTLPAVLEQLQLVHSAAYLRRIDEICTSLTEPTLVDDSTYISPSSFRASCETAAAAFTLLDAVLSATHDPPAAFCLGRPPGHHVLPARPMGFGLVNVVAAAAARALQQPGVHRVAVIDFDVHHGNGTEDIFFGNPDVLYVSTHQQGLWPYTGKATSLGSGAARGATVNVPLPGGSGHAAMRMAFAAVVEPALRRFQPDVMLVSAGYDAHWRDPLAGMQLRGETYHWLCARLRCLAQELCGGRCLFVLEGGYHLQSLAESVTESMRGLSGLPCCTGADPKLQHLQPEPLGKVEQVLQQAQRLHGL